jgi:hypothetical protein
MAVVGGGGPERLEERPPRPVSGEVAGPCRRILSRQRAKSLHVFGEARELRVHDGVGPVGRHHAPRPSAVADHGVPAQVVERALGRRDHLDPEPLEQRAGPEFLARETIGDPVVYAVRRLRRQSLVDPEDLLEGMVEPEARRGPSEQVKMRREAPPDGAGVLLDRPAVGARHAQLLERDALRMEHPEDVVVGGHEEARGVGESRVLGIPARIGMAVGADDGKAAHRAVERAGYAAGAVLDREQTVLVEQRHAVSPP